MKAKVLLVQNGPATVDTEKNVDENLALVAEATKDYSPDFVVFSELSNTQYFCGYNTPEHFKLAEPIDGPSVSASRSWPSELGATCSSPSTRRARSRASSTTAWRSSAATAS